jgi:hypothetical protein
MYVLPNKKHIDSDGAIEAILNEDISRSYFLDTEKGDIGCVVWNGEVDTLENFRKQSGRYFEVPRTSRATKEEWMHDFVEEMVPFEDIPLSEKLLSETSEKFYENALNEITISKDGWIYAWVQWSHDSAFGILEDWLGTLPVDITYEWEGCDDCAICKAMMEGKDSAPELFKAFGEQNFMNEVESVIQQNKGTL